MAARAWPIFGLRLSGPRVSLRPWTESDLDHLTAIVPPDAEPNPHLPSHPLGDPSLERAINLCRAYWDAWARWSGQHWRLGFVVAVDGSVVGFCEIEAEDFPRRRVVGTGSWLVETVRGRGLGKEVRAVLLALAFRELGALAAETEAWHDNAASLGVSRALGYEPNGESVHARGDGRDRMIHMRLTRERWQQGPWAGVPARVEGLQRCLPLFGLAVADLAP